MAVPTAKLRRNAAKPREPRWCASSAFNASLKGKPMKHEIHRLQSITDARARHAGALQFYGQGLGRLQRRWPPGRHVRIFVRKLLSLAARQST